MSSGNALIITGQSSGRLNAYGGRYISGRDDAAGSITISGGTITATSGSKVADIDKSHV